MELFDEDESKERVLVGYGYKTEPNTYADDGQSENKNSLFAHRRRQDLEFRNVCLTVGSDRVILSQCWGKTSLLNVLAGRVKSSSHSTVTCHVRVNSTAINPLQFRQHVAYVMQQDTLFATCSPRECLMFSAALRLPQHQPSYICDAVEQTIRELGLESCADTLVGDVLIPGLSGGEKKRVSVGLELITNPSIIFLDEPTSGLDSYAGFQLISLLKNIAASDATVVCTLHQPSSEIFYLFNRVIFLKEGRIVYQGSGEDLVIWLSSNHFVCPEHYNPADYLMNICHSHSLEKLSDMLMLMPPPVLISLLKQDSTQLLEAIHKAPISTQLYWIINRELKNTIRNKPAMFGRFGVAIIVSALFSLIFYRVGNRDDSNPENFDAHVGAVTMVTISSMFNSALPALLEFPSERPIFLREYARGTYSVTTYTCGKMILELPLAFIQSLFQTLIVYYLISFQGNLLYIVLALWGTGLTSSGLAILLGCLVEDPKQAVEMAPLLFVPQILFAGFFIRTSLIPVWIRWIQYLCPLKYGINLFFLNEFARFRSSCDNDAAANCRQVLTGNDIVYSDWWIYALILAALSFSFRIVAIIALAAKAFP